MQCEKATYHDELHGATQFYVLGVIRTVTCLTTCLAHARARVCVVACNSTNEIPCGLGPCVAAERYCDGTADCVDGSDEVRGCRKYTRLPAVVSTRALPLIAIVAQK